MSSPAIEIVGLRKSYGSLEAVGGLDLSVAEGEVFALLGPNGAVPAGAVLRNPSQRREIDVDPDRSPGLDVSAVPTDRLAFPRFASPQNL